MAKLTLSATFVKKFNSQIPDEDKPNVFRAYSFTIRFKLFPQTDETREELKDIQHKHGIRGLLDHVMIKVEEAPSGGVELCDADGTPISAEEWVKSHLIVQQDALMAFYDVINKGVEEKNSKKSR